MKLMGSYEAYEDERPLKLMGSHEVYEDERPMKLMKIRGLMELM